jgi:hypothetical protein
MERFNLMKLNEVEGKEQFCFEMSNRFAALKDLDAEVEINSAWETIRPRRRWVDNIRMDLGEVGWGEFCIEPLGSIKSLGSHRVATQLVSHPYRTTSKIIV